MLDERSEAPQAGHDRVGLVIELFHDLLASVTLLEVCGDFLQ